LAGVTVSSLLRLATFISVHTLFLCYNRVAPIIVKARPMKPEP
jgi:hypothetical protein